MTCPGQVHSERPAHDQLRPGADGPPGERTHYAGRGWLTQPDDSVHHGHYREAHEAWEGLFDFALRPTDGGGRG